MTHLEGKHNLGEVKQGLNFHKISDHMHYYEQMRDFLNTIT